MKYCECSASRKQVDTTARGSYSPILDVLYGGETENTTAMKVIQGTALQQSWCKVIMGKVIMAKCNVVYFSQ